MPQEEKLFPWAGVTFLMVTLLVAIVPESNSWLIRIFEVLKSFFSNGQRYNFHYQSISGLFTVDTVPVAVDVAPVIISDPANAVRSPAFVVPVHCV